MGKKNKGHRHGMERTAEKTARKDAKREAREAQRYDEDLAAELEAQKKAVAAPATEEIPRPSPRAHCSIVCHPNGEQLIMFGGELLSGGQHTFFRDVLRYRPDRGGPWTRAVSPSGPLLRCAHQEAAVRFGGRDLMWVFGGEFSTKDGERFRHFGDLWALDLGSGVWTEAEARAASAAAGMPHPRSGHRMVAWKKKLVLFGGYFEAKGVTKYMNDLWLYDMETSAWHLVELPETAQRPDARSGCQLALNGDTLFVIGGFARQKKERTPAAAAAIAAARCRKGKKKAAEPCDYDDDEEDEKEVFFNDVWSINLSDITLASVPEQQQTPPAAATAATTASTAATEESAVKAKVAAWEKVKAGGRAPTPRTGMCSTVYKHRVYCFGGVADEADGDGDMRSVFFNEVVSFNMEKLKWFPGKLKDGAYVPSERYGCQSVLCGPKMYVWGGLVEMGETEFTYDDLHVLDLNKLDNFTCVLEPTRIAKEEAEEDDEDEEDGDEDDEEGSSSSSSSSGEEEEGEAATTPATATEAAEEETEAPLDEATKEALRAAASEVAAAAAASAAPQATVAHAPSGGDAPFVATI